MRRRAVAAALLAASLGAAAAPPEDEGPKVTLNGSLGASKALLVIDGVARTVGVGETVQGVKLVTLADGGATVEIGGRRLQLRIGAAPVRLGSAAKDGGGREIVLDAGPGGHFVAGGSINGAAVQFLVDTGASVVAIGQPDAERIGLAWRNAPRGMAGTANGTVPVHRVTLSSVRLGDIEIYNVEAVVVPGAMPHVLLGNSFLTRFQMKRENDRLTLVRRL